MRVTGLVPDRTSSVVMDKRLDLIYVVKIEKVQEGGNRTDLNRMYSIPIPTYAHPNPVPGDSGLI